MDNKKKFLVVILIGILFIFFQNFTSAAPDFSPMSSSNNKKILQDFAPYVRATALYVYKNDRLGSDYINSLQFVDGELAKIKANGFNTILWNMPWYQIQPRAKTSLKGEYWNTEMLRVLSAYLDLIIKKHNMRVIYFLNTNGPGWTPDGIDGCNWMSKPSEREAFFSYTTQLTRYLKNYNWGVYYMVHSEQPAFCKKTLFPNLFKYQENYLQSKSENLILNQWMKESIGALPNNLPQDVRENVFLGFHDDYFLVENVFRKQFNMNEQPIAQNANGTNSFDFISMAMYPSYSFAKTIPTPAAVNDLTANQTVQNKITTWLNGAVSSIKNYFPQSTLMLGEFGWRDVNDDSGSPLIKNLQSLQKLAVIKSVLNWSDQTKIGINIWGWMPRYLDSFEVAESRFEEGYALNDRMGNVSISLMTICKHLKGELNCPQYYSAVESYTDKTYRLRSGSIAWEGDGKLIVKCNWGKNIPCGLATIENRNCRFLQYSTNSDAVFDCSNAGYKDGDVVYCKLFDYQNDVKCKSYRSQAGIGYFGKTPVR